MPVDDGWVPEADLPLLRTEVAVERPRRVITRIASPDIPFDRSINPFRGCEHGCVYCFARPSHAYLGLSPGLDFDTRLIARPEAPRMLDRELRAPGYRPGVIALGTSTDPYQPVERLTRHARDPRGAAAVPPPALYRYEREPDRARHRHPERDGGGLVWRGWGSA